MNEPPCISGWLERLELLERLERVHACLAEACPYAVPGGDYDGNRQCNQGQESTVGCDRWRAKRNADIADCAKAQVADQVRQAIRTRHYSDKTEKAYVHWIKRFIFFHNKRHPMEMAEAEIGQFLSSLATDGHVSASTQNQAFNAILFLYDQVLGKKIGLIDGVVRAKRPQRLPVVLTKEEVKEIINHMSGVSRLMVILLYGAGLRLMECCRLRVKDIDFYQNEILVRAGKGNKDRHTPLPTTVRDPLIEHLRTVKS